MDSRPAGVIRSPMDRAAHSSRGLSRHGSGPRIFLQNNNRKVPEGMLGFASRVRLTASDWSLPRARQRDGETPGASAGCPRGWLPCRRRLFIWAVTAPAPPARRPAAGKRGRNQLELALQQPPGTRDHYSNIPDGACRPSRLGHWPRHALGLPGLGRRPWRSASVSRTSPKARRFPSRCDARGCPAARASGTASYRAWWSRSPVS